MCFEDWDIIRQVTASLSTITDTVKQADGDSICTTSSLVLSFARIEFPMSSVHGTIESAHKSISEDLELRWVTNLRAERKGFYLIATQLDPHTKLLSFCDQKYFPPSWKDEDNDFLPMEFKSFYILCKSFYILYRDFYLQAAISDF